jgi:hypothetical protein
MLNNKLEEKFYIPCKVGKGTFSSEYLIEITDFNNEKKRDFVDKTSVKIRREPQDNEYVDGFLKIIKIYKSGFKALIQLPTENCDRIYFPADKLELFI